ncbi:MAG: hypothetical protein WCH99_20085 [Verrucomicrobiota bacterium]
MAHKIIEFLISLMGVIGIIVSFIGFMVVAMDVIDVYLRFRKHLLNGDFCKRKDRE